MHASAAPPFPIILNDFFQVVSYNGGHRTGDGSTDPHYWVYNCLKVSDLIHSSRRSNCDLVLRYPCPDDDCFTLTHFVARAPRRSEFPLKAGFVWVTDEEPDIEAYTNSYTYTSPATVEHTERAHPTKPVLSFFLRGSLDAADDQALQVVHEFTTWPRGRYIHIKLCEAHRIGPLSFIDVQYVGLVGFRGQGVKPRRIGPLPVQWNITRRPHQRVNPVHTDFQDLLYDTPCLIVFTGSDLTAYNVRVREALEKIAQLPHVAERINFFLHTLDDLQVARPEELDLLTAIAFDVKASLIAPLALILDRPVGKYYNIGNSVTTFTFENLREFVYGYLDGTWPMWRAGEEVPNDDTDPHFPQLRTVVAATFDTIALDPRYDVLLLISNTLERYTWEDWLRAEEPGADGWGPVGPVAGQDSVHYSVRKVAEYAKAEKGLVIGTINAYYNWVPKEFVQPNGVLALFPRDKTQLITFAVSAARPLASSYLLSVLIDHTQGRYATALTPLMHALYKQEKQREFHRDGIPEALPPTTPAELRRAIAPPTVSTADDLRDFAGELLLIAPVASIEDQMQAALQAVTSRQATYQMYVELHIAPLGTDEKLLCLHWNSASDWIAVCGDGETRCCLFRLRGDPKSEYPSNRPVHSLHHTPPNPVHSILFAAKTERLVTADVAGQLRLWEMSTDRHWKDYNGYAHQDKGITALGLSPDDQRLCAVYEDGYAIVVELLGEVLWKKPLCRGIERVCWSPGAKWLLAASPQMLQVFTSDGDFVAHVLLRNTNSPHPSTTCISDRIVGCDWYNVTRPPELEDLPSLVIAFQLGRLQLMRNYVDETPVVLTTDIRLASCAWNPTGTYVAVAGTVPGVGGPEVVRLYSLTGTFRGQVQLPLGTQPVKQISWQGSGSRLLALTGDGAALVVRVRGHLRRGAPHTTAFREAAPNESILYVAAEAGALNADASALAKLSKSPSKAKKLSQVSLVDGSAIGYGKALEIDASGALITDDQIAAQFASIDKDGNGFITKAEFRRLYDQLEKFGVEEGDKWLDEQLDRFNMLADDRLSYDEFSLLMLRIAQR